MPRPLLRLLAAAGLTLGGSTLLLSCDGATAPDPNDPSSSTMVVDAIKAGRVRTGDTITYRVDGLARTQHPTLHLQVLSGQVNVTVLDNGNRVRASLSSGVTTGELGEFGTRRFKVEEPPLRVRMTGEGEYRLRLYFGKYPPETRQAQFAINDTVRGESIEVLADYDVYTFDAVAGEELAFYLQARDRRRAARLLAAVEGNGLALSVSTFALPPDTLDLERNGYRSITIPLTGTYTLRIVGDTTPLSAPFVGPYTFMMRRIDPTPETAKSRVVAGDTIADALDYVGDRDAYQLVGDADAEYSLAFASQPDRPSDFASLTIAGVTTLRGDVPTTPLGRKASGIFTMPGSGTTTVTVAAVDADSTRGPYQFALWKVQRQPESAPAHLAPSDTITGEAIDHPGDIDEFTVTVPSGSVLNVWAYPDSQHIRPPSGRGFEYRVSRAAPAPPDSSAPPDRLGPGSYRVRVASGEPYHDPFTGGYAIVYHMMSTAPESAGPSVVIGGTIDERIDRPGDVDVFSFEGQRGDHVDIQVEGMAGTAEGILDVGIAMLTPPPSTMSQVWQFWAPRDAAGVGPTTAGRITLPVTGTYTIRVFMNERYTGRYRLGVRAVSAAPETHRDPLRAGDTVRTEGLDFRGDVDEFEVIGAPGDDLLVAITSGTGTAGIAITLVDPATRQPLETQRSFGDRRLLDRFQLPPTGRVLVRVHEAISLGINNPYVLTGPYTLDVARVNRDP